MNPWQMAQQLKHLLEQARWPTGSGDLIFGSATQRIAVFSGTPTDRQIPPAFPWCLIEIAEAEADEDSPDLLTQTFRLIVAAEVAGDRMGEAAVIGGAAPNLGKSAGRGVTELASEVRRTVGSLTGMDGARVIVSAASSGPVAPLSTGGHVAMADVSLRAMCTSLPHYAAPQRLRYNVTRWEWDGDHCAARYDFLRYRVLRKNGTHPSSNPSDGTVVYTGTEARWTGSQISGQIYTVFAQYNSRGGTAVEASSDPDVGSYRAP